MKVKVTFTVANLHFENWVIRVRFIWTSENHSYDTDEPLPGSRKKVNYHVRKILLYTKKESPHNDKRHVSTATAKLRSSVMYNEARRN